MSEKTRALIVDDDKNILQIIKLYLRKEGFEVVEALRGTKVCAYLMCSPQYRIAGYYAPGHGRVAGLQRDQKILKHPDCYDYREGRNLR